MCYNEYGPDFEWDIQKEKRNISKHGLDFETASKVFKDRNRIEFYDSAHSDGEDRFITIGSVNNISIVVTIVYTERISTIRIISARMATKAERRKYYDC